MELDKVTHLDLGCGPVGMRVEELLRHGIDNCAGIDENLSSQNGDFMAMKWAWGRLREEYPEVAAYWMMEDGPQVFPKKRAEDRLIQGDVVDVIRLFGREQINFVYGDYFFQELDDYQMPVVRAELDRVLNPGGTVLATMHEGEEEDRVRKMFAGGYRVEDRTINYGLVTNDLKYWKAIEEINGKVCVQIALAKCETAAR